MNKTKLAILLSVPALALGIGVSPTVSKVYAQSKIQTAEVKQSQVRTDGTSEQNSMVEMMKSHHGNNWKEDCTKMMDQLDDNST